MFLVHFFYLFIDFFCISFVFCALFSINVMFQIEIFQCLTTFICPYFIFVQTLNRKRPTFGGYSTKQEMCLSFITYYPKIDLAGCYSMTPVKEFFETFGVYEFHSMNMTDVENLFLYNGFVSISNRFFTENVVDAVRHHSVCTRIK